MDLTDDEKCMPIPANYVSLAPLKERWLKKQEEMRRGASTESGGGDRVVGYGGLVIREGDSSEKGKEVAMAGSGHVKRSKPLIKKENKLGKGNARVKNNFIFREEKCGELESEIEVKKGNQIVKYGSENGEERVREKTKDYRRRKNYRRKANKKADGEKGNEIGVEKILEEGIEIKARVSEDSNDEDRGISIGIEGIKGDSSVSATEILPRIATKREISNSRRARQSSSSWRYQYRMKKDNLVNGNEAKDTSMVLELETKVDELKLADEIVIVNLKVDESKGVTEEYTAEKELTDRNTLEKGKEKAAEKSAENGEGWRNRNYSKRNGGIWGRQNGSRGYRKYNEFEGSSRSKKTSSNNRMVWVKKCEKSEANNA